MSSSEPPSRSGPRQNPHEYKTERDQLHSKGKVEKVREVDPDEKARKQKQFLKFYKPDQGEENKTAPQEPNFFELYTENEKAAGKKPPELATGPLDNPSNNVTTPTPPPSDALNEGALPQSNDFWNDVNLPDTPPNQQMQPQNQMPTPPKGDESSSDADSLPVPKEQAGTSGATPEHKKKSEEIEKKEKAKALEELKVDQKKKGHKQQQAKQKETVFSEQKTDRSSKKGAPSSSLKKAKQTSEKAIEKPRSSSKAPSQKKLAPQKKEKEPEEGALFTPAPAQKSEGTSPEFSDKKEKASSFEIETSTLPNFPPHIQPQVVQATTQSMPYLTSSTTPLFFQMVGTIYLLANKSGVQRTEIILNSPAYANSKFFGSVIVIEKYSTAPNSFNIRLRGSQQAVKTFKENIPNLLSAFQNGGFSFKVNRLDAEYTTERPIFRRKDRKGSSDDSSGNFGGKK